MIEDPDILITDGAFPIPYINDLKILRIHDVLKGLRVLSTKPLINRYVYVVASYEILRGEFINMFNIYRNRCVIISLAIEVHSTHLSLSRKGKTSYYLLTDEESIGIYGLLFKCSNMLGVL